MFDFNSKRGGRIVSVMMLVVLLIVLMALGMVGAAPSMWPCC